MNYPSIRIEGAIFSPDILDRLEDAPGLGNKISTSSTRRPPRAEIFSHPWTAKKALQKRGFQQNIYEGPDEGQRAGQKNKPLKIKGLFMQMAEKVRFELTVLAYTRVPGVHLKPLGHLSIKIQRETLLLSALSRFDKGKIRSRPCWPWLQLPMACSFTV